MSQDDKVMMAEYGITAKTITIYSYKEHRYDKLQDAVNFARLDTKPVEKK